MQAVINPPLVLLCCGCREEIAALQAEAAAALAGAMGLQLGPAIGQGAPSLAAAAAELAALPAASLVPLGLDAGVALGDGSHWAEALGASRQVCLLLLRGEQLRSGAAAATTALLHQWQAPLLGLVQADGSWDATARRNDGLPWLGAAGDEGMPAAARLRWNLVQGMVCQDGGKAAALES